MGVSKEVNDAIDVVGRIYEILRPAKVVSQEITLKCPEKEGEYSVAIEIRRGIRRKLGRILKFKFPSINRLTVRSLPLMRDESQAVTRQSDGFELNTDLLSDSDLYLLDFDFTVEDDRYLKSLVRRDVEKEALGANRDEYWMHAQLKHPRVLQSHYGRIDLRDVDFLVDVAVHQDIRDVIPKPFVRDLEIIRNWIRETERTKKIRLTMEHLRQRSTGLVGKESDILNDLQELFLPRTFSQFVEVTPMFKFYDCIRGTDFFDDVPFPTFPKIMKIVSRTDLTLATPAAEGRLIYDRADFRDQLSQLFPRRLRS